MGTMVILGIKRGERPISLLTLRWFESDVEEERRKRRWHIQQK